MSLDWNEEIEDWVCQAHGLPECAQTEECLSALEEHNADTPTFDNGWLS